MRRFVAALAVSLPLLTSPFLAAPTGTPGRFDLKDLAKLVRISDPQISPDGTKICYVCDEGEGRDGRAGLLPTIRLSYSKIAAVAGPETWDQVVVSVPLGSPSSTTVPVSVA